MISDNDKDKGRSHLGTVTMAHEYNESSTTTTDNEVLDIIKVYNAIATN